MFDLPAFVTAEVAGDEAAKGCIIDLAPSLLLRLAVSPQLGGNSVPRVVGRQFARHLALAQKGRTTDLRIDKLPMTIDGMTRCDLQRKGKKGRRSANDKGAKRRLD
jgi:hypothetical protein